MDILNEQKNILVVDDEASIRDSLKLILGRNYQVTIAEDGNKALNFINSSQSNIPDLIILDVMMPGIDGISLLEQIKVEHPSLPIIMISASNTVKTAVQAMKVGAVDYLNKPYDVDELLTLISETLDKNLNSTSGNNNVISIKDSRPGLANIEADYGSIVGAHPLMKEIYSKIDQVASRDTTVLITGESGTGKELIAKEIHKRSSRKSGPFVAINCAAIPESLIESELFGHEKGSFTHAVDKRVGYFELANKGTLFLDEIGELSLNVQVKILRFLQEHEFYRVGRSKPTEVDVRILAATNRNLETCIQEGKFRQDLFYRIHVVSVDLPPLRKRREDVPTLVQFFTNRLSPLYGNKKIIFSAEAIQALESYSWPGNVRELENVVESILALNNKEEVGLNDLPSRFKQIASSASELKLQVIEGNIPFEEAEKAFERDIILKALQKCNYIQTKAAEMLGISRRILKYKMDKLGIGDNEQ